MECICGKGEDCIDAPSAEVCLSLGGDSFRGSLTTCASIRDLPPVKKTDGACCIPRKYDQDIYLCEMVPTKTECDIQAGVWNGARSKCTDEICSAIVGRCCIRRHSYKQGENSNSGECKDSMTAMQCKQECNYGNENDECHWGGPESLCSDEFACDPAHHGACCRDNQPCSLLTVKSCHHTKGSFQGFDSKCQDLHNGVCKVCRPCTVKAPECSETQKCENKGAVCVREYGKCMVIAKPIDSLHTSSTMPPATTAPIKRSVEDAPRVDAIVVVAKQQPAPFIGQLSCGDESTIGLPCLAKPLFGKCRIGVCTAPPQGTTLSKSCKSVCRDIKDYECGCDCRDSWKKKCGVITGRVSEEKKIEKHTDSTSSSSSSSSDKTDDLSSSSSDEVEVYDNNNGKGVAGATVKLFRRNNQGHDRNDSDFDGDEYELVAQQTTGYDGHYSFSGLAPGEYDVHVKGSGCLTLKRDHSKRAIEVECLEGAQFEKTSKHAKPTYKHNTGGVTTERVAKASHLADRVDFSLVDDCHEKQQRDAYEYQNPHRRSHHHSGGETRAPSFVMFVVWLFTAYYFLNRSNDGHYHVVATA